jgi:high affinity sulfate transporter 1
MRFTRRAGGQGAVTAGLTQLRGYRPDWFRADLLAGITVTAYLVPQCLAYADLAGVEPVTGLWVAVVAMVAYALLGTSRQLSVGPESATAVMVAAAVAPLAAGDPARYAALAAGLALLVGLVCIVAFVLRLGFLADLLSQPILIGYMAGVALIMIGSQLATITGVTLTSDGAIAKTVELSGKAGDVQPAAVAMGLGVTAFLLILQRVAPLAPGSLIAVVGAAVIVYVFDLAARGIALVGPVPSGLPSIALPALGVGDVTALFGSAAAIAFVAYTDVALTGRAFAVRTGEVIDANREFLGLGVANVASGLTGGFALSASGSRTAIIDAVRAHSQVAGLVAAASVVVVVLAVPGLISYIPRAALGGIVVFAALRLIDVAALRRLGRFRMSELGLALAALFGVLVFDVLAGILIAVGLSVADLFVRIARPPASVLGQVPGLAGLHDIDDYPQAHQVPGLLVFRYDAPLCFANAEDFRTRALDAVDEANEGPTPIEWFLLNAEAIVELDMTSAAALRRLVDELAERRVSFAMARVKQDFRAQLARGGLIGQIDEARIFPTLPVALEAFEHRAERGGAAGA